MQTSDGVPIEMVKEHPHLARQCFVVANKDGALRPLRVSKRITGALRHLRCALTVSFTPQKTWLQLKAQPAEEQMPVAIALH